MAFDGLFSFWAYNLTDRPQTCGNKGLLAVDRAGGPIFLGSKRKMLTFEELRPIFYKWANHYQNNNFEFWELINAVWIRGEVQSLVDIRLASNAIRCDMIDYMRSMSDGRKNQRAQARGEVYPKIYLFSANVDEDGEELVLNKGRPEEGYAEVESRDFFNGILRGLSLRQQLLIRLRYQKGYTFKQVSRTLGITKENAWQIHFKVLKILRQRLIDSGEFDANRPCLARPLPSRDKEGIRRYNKMYYLHNKGRISLRRKLRRLKRTA